MYIYVCVITKRLGANKVQPFACFLSFLQNEKHTLLYRELV
jgi:hypothetical protein